MNNKYQRTMYACFVGYIVQAIVNNFVPLLFLTFEKTYNIHLGRITMLITINFGVQLMVDLKKGILAAIVFPVLMLFGIAAVKRGKRYKKV